VNTKSAVCIQDWLADAATCAVLAGILFDQKWCRKAEGASMTTSLDIQQLLTTVARPAWAPRNSPRPSAGNDFSALLASQMATQKAMRVTSGGDHLVRVEFPPSEAPDAFRKAWEMATNGMDSQDKMTYELQIWGNLHPEYCCIPGGEPLVGPPESSLSSYQEILKNFLESLETRPELYSTAQLVKDKAFFGNLKLLLDQVKA
jgi:hypothetical protein